jgi:hypothetical protein
VNPVTLISTALISVLLAAYRSKLILGAAILGFSGAGVGLLIGSYLTTGWWQALQLAVGTSLLFVGTVELGILGLLRRVLGEDGADGKDRADGQARSDIQASLRMGASDTISLTHLTASQIAAVFNALANTDDSKVDVSVLSSNDALRNVPGGEPHAAEDEHHSGQSESRVSDS